LSEECRKREEESLVSLFSGENVEREEEGSGMIVEAAYEQGQS
jgi:hypothetical protein